MGWLHICDIVISGRPDIILDWFSQYMVCLSLSLMACLNTACCLFLIHAGRFSGFSALAASMASSDISPSNFCRVWLGPFWHMLNFALAISVLVHSCRLANVLFATSKMARKNAFNASASLLVSPLKVVRSFYAKSLTVFVAPIDIMGGMVQIGSRDLSAYDPMAFASFCECLCWIILVRR